MFKTNVGKIDRVFRICVGIALLVFFALTEESIRWFGLIGLVPLATGIFATCPAYSIFGVNTCAKS